MLIAQVTDVHLGFVPDDPDEPNRRRIDAVLAALRATVPPPDMLFATGDLVDRGDDHASYARLAEALAAAPCPVHLMLGNHDSREPFRYAFPHAPMADGFAQFVVEAGGLRCVALDTLEEGRHGGAFCERRARWLSDTLDAEPDRPTLILLHHPPCRTGIAWMDADPAEPWVARLAAVLGGRGNVVALLAGHVHRAVSTRWMGLPVVICPPSSPEVALELRPIDPDRPDGRAMIVDAPPAYALHHWDGERLLTHFAAAEARTVLARFDEGMRPLVRDMLAERPPA